MPPLRQRKEDIPILVEYFLKRYADKARKQFSRIEKNTLKLCQSYDWPGNIRELQNIIERSVILCTGDTFWIDEAWLSSQNAPRLESSGPLKQNLQNYEKEPIEAALVESKGKVAGPTGAAAKLGIPRSQWTVLDPKGHRLAHIAAVPHSFFHPSTVTISASRVPNRISLKTGLEKEIGVTES